jgi:hypothetical protein
VPGFHETFAFAPQCRRISRFDRLPVQPRIARQIRSGLAGPVKSAAPKVASASRIALPIAGNAATVPASPQPLTPNGLVVQRVGPAASCVPDQRCRDRSADRTRSRQAALHPAEPSLITAGGRLFAHNEVPAMAACAEITMTGNRLSGKSRCAVFNSRHAFFEDRR